MTKDAVLQLYQDHGAFVVRVVRRLGVPPRDAEDVAQDVFMIAFRQIESFDGRSAKGWLFRIAARRAHAYRKKKGNRNETLGEESKEMNESASQTRHVWRQEMRSLLDEALDRLSEEHRQIFLLAELESLPMSEIANIVGCPMQTGYSRLKRARSMMKDALIELSSRGDQDRISQLQVAP